MADLQTIIRTIHDLSVQDKQSLRDLLDAELSAPSPPNGSDSAATNANPLLGLLSDGPELADQIVESAMRARETRPLRTTRG